MNMRLNSHDAKLPNAETLSLRPLLNKPPMHILSNNSNLHLSFRLAMRKGITYFFGIGLLAIALLATPQAAKAQFNAYSFTQKFENKWAHFGILMGYNRSEFRIRNDEQFIFNDSIGGIESLKGPGFNLGMVTNVHLGKNFDLRFLPSMTFAERNLTYSTFLDTSFSQTIESINVDIPILLKFKSNPYKDMRFYVLAGMRYSLDLASNANARNAEDIVKVGQHDLLVEYGFGLEFYFPYFIFAPELRLSQGLFDVHALDPNLTFSNVLERLFTRSIAIVINLEG